MMHSTNEWCMYFKNAGKIAHMMTPLNFYHKMENDDDADNCSNVALYE